MQKIVYFLVAGLAFMALQVATVEADHTGMTGDHTGMTGDHTGSTGPG